VNRHCYCDAKARHLTIIFIIITIITILLHGLAYNTAGSIISYWELPDIFKILVVIIII
jgi:hypothetical protein